MKRAAWREGIAGVRPEDLVVVDESGANVRLTRPYARAPRAERAVGRVPRNHGKATSLVAALTPGGLAAPRRRLGAFNAGNFAAYVEQVLCPALRPGQVVVLAGALWALSIHKDRRVRTAIEGAGCRLLFLPPYSPDFSPIENAWSKHPGGTRAALRRAGARAQDALDRHRPGRRDDHAPGRPSLLPPLRLPPRSMTVQAALITWRILIAFPLTSPLITTQHRQTWPHITAQIAHDPGGEQTLADAILRLPGN